MKTKFCKILLSISFGFALTIAACIKKGEECIEAPTALNTLKISAFEFESGGFSGKPLKDISFQINRDLCNVSAETPTQEIKSELLRTNEKGEINLIDTTFKDIFCGSRECRSEFRFFPLNVQLIRASAYVLWEKFDSSDRKIHLFKKSLPLQLEIKINKPEVKNFSITTYQGNPRRDLQTFAFPNPNNGQNGSLGIVFYVPKGEDTKLEIKLDNVFFRTDTIKQTQRDTLFGVITI